MADDEDEGGTEVGDEINMKGLVAAIAEELMIDKGEVTRVILALKRQIETAMIEGRTVNMGRDFGRFVTIRIEGRPSRGAGGARIEAKPSRKMRFRPSAIHLKKLPLL